MECVEVNVDAIDLGMVWRMDPYAMPQAFCLGKLSSYSPIVLLLTLYQLRLSFSDFLRL